MGVMEDLFNDWNMGIAAKHRGAAPSLLQRLQFVPMETDDIGDVQQVREGMSDDDMLDDDELLGRMAAGRLRAWWAVVDGERVGWCALAPRHGRYAEGAWHLYGSWVRPDHRRQGIAAMMWHMRLKVAGKEDPKAPVTTSIQPSKDASFALAAEYGFRHEPERDRPPWATYILDHNWAAPPQSLDEAAGGAAVSDIQVTSRVMAEGYDVAGEVLQILARDDGRIAKVLHDDGLENWYRIEQLTIAPDAGTVRYVRPRT